MELELQRDHYSAIATTGMLSFDGVLRAYTLERPSLHYPMDFHCIPAGRYSISLYPSPHFKRIMPLLDVPGHEGIEMHWGNYPRDSHGCILVGTTRGQDVIFNTYEKFEEIFPIIESGVNSGSCFITVKDGE